MRFSSARVLPQRLNSTVELWRARKSPFRHVNGGSRTTSSRSRRSPHSLIPSLAGCDTFGVFTRSSSPVESQRGGSQVTGIGRFWEVHMIVLSPCRGIGAAVDKRRAEGSVGRLTATCRDSGPEFRFARDPGAIQTEPCIQKRLHDVAHSGRIMGHEGVPGGKVLLTVSDHCESLRSITKQIDLKSTKSASAPAIKNAKPNRDYGTHRQPAAGVITISYDLGLGRVEEDAYEEFRSAGSRLPVIAPTRGVVSGQVVIDRQHHSVCASTTSGRARGRGQCDGVYDLPKTPADALARRVTSPKSIRRVVEPGGYRADRLGRTWSPGGSGAARVPADLPRSRKVTVITKRRSPAKNGITFAAVRNIESIT